MARIERGVTVHLRAYVTRALVFAATVCLLGAPSPALAGHSVANSFVEWRVPTAAGNQYRPVLSGYDLAFEDFGLGNSDISHANLMSQAAGAPLTTNTFTDLSPVIWGRRVAWTANNGAGTDVAYREAPLGVMRLLGRAGNQTAGGIWGTRIVFSDANTGSGDIYMVDIAVPLVSPICTEAHAQMSPTIFGDLIVWTDYRNGNADLYSYDLRTSTERRLTSDPANENSPELWGTDLVFVTDKNDAGDIARMERITAPDLAMPTIYHLGGQQSSPSIWNERIVWAEDSGNIWALDPFNGGPDGTPLVVTNDAFTHQDPSISGDLVAYGTITPGGADIYCTNLLFPHLPLSTFGTWNYGSTAIVNGTLIGGPGIPLTGKTVGLQIADEYGWVSDPTIPPTLSGPNGVFAFGKIGIQRNTTVRAVYREPGDGGYMTGAGDPITILVRASISKPSGPSKVKRYGKFTTACDLKPHHTAGSGAITVKCYRRIGGKYKLRKTVTAYASDYSTYSRYSARFSLPTKGRWKIVATHADSDHAASASTARYVTVK
jgi:beta propeller repeat protein